MVKRKNKHTHFLLQISSVLEKAVNFSFSKLRSPTPGFTKLLHAMTLIPSMLIPIQRLAILVFIKAVRKLL